MQFLSNAPLKSIVAAAAALMVLAIPAQADDTTCFANCQIAASQAQHAAEASAAAALQTSCSQNARTYEEYATCVAGGQSAIAYAGQNAYYSTLDQCNGQCMAAHY